MGPSICRHLHVALVPPVPPGGALSVHSAARAGAPRWGSAEQGLGCFRRGSAVNRCGCGNAVAGGSGHCWTLGGDVRTDTGALSGWLLSKLAGLFLGVMWLGAPVSLGTEQLCVCFFKNSTHFFLGIFLPCWGGDENEREARKDSPAPWSHALQAAWVLTQQTPRGKSPSGGLGSSLPGRTSTFFPGPIFLLTGGKDASQLSTSLVVLEKIKRLM